jgi:uncharacterized low-complexity protein
MPCVPLALALALALALTLVVVVVVVATVRLVPVSTPELPSGRTIRAEGDADEGACSSSELSEKAVERRRAEDIG